MTEYTPITGLDENSTTESHPSDVHRRTCLFVVILLLILMMVSVITFTILTTTDDDSDNGSYDGYLNPIALSGDLAVFQSIASLHQGSRSVSTGYDASANFVFASLEGTGWIVKRQEIQFDQWVLHGAVLSDLTLGYPFFLGQDFDVVVNSGSEGEISNLKIVLAKNDGCSPDDYESIIPKDCPLDFDKKGSGPKYGVLATEGGCTPFQKLTAAQSQDFTVLFISKNINHTSLALDALPKAQDSVVIALSHAAASLMSTRVCGNSFGNTPSRFDLGMNATVLLNVKTHNIIADYPTNKVSRPNEVLVLGAHLDSPLNSPGINTNAAGASVLLEIAKTFEYLDIEPISRPRLCWWSGSYYGNVGSQSYIDSLDEDALNQIVAYINVEQIASTNFIYHIYDPTLFDDDLKKPGEKLTDTMVKALHERGVDSFEYATEWETNWSNDQEAFNRQGIVSSGYFTGNEPRKTTQQKLSYDGAANAPLDPCFALSCDEEYNYNTEVLNTIGNSLVTVLRSLLQKPNLKTYLYG